MSSTSLNIQVDGNNSQRSIVVSEVTPELQYYITPTSDGVSYASITDMTTLTFSESFDTDEYNEMVVLVLDGIGRGKCFTIYNTTTNTVVVYEDATSYITTSSHVAIVHTAATMYAYCVEKSKDCVTLTCESVGMSEGSNENPLSLASHITYRYGTGIHDQGATFNNCDIWDQDARVRNWKLGQVRNLIFHWNKIRHQQATYLIMTIEQIDSNGVSLYQNNDFFQEEDNYEDIECRGYLKGYPLKITTTYTWNGVFNLTFMEAWQS